MNIFKRFRKQPVDTPDVDYTIKKGLTPEKITLKPLETRVLVAHVSELRLVKALELDAEKIQLQDPYTNKTIRIRNALAPVVGVGLAKRRLRVHFQLWGEPCTRDPRTGAIADPKLVYSEMLNNGHIDKEGKFTYLDGTTTQLFEVKGNDISVRNWPLYDFTTMRYLASQEAIELHEKAHQALGEGLTKDPERMRKWTDVIIPIVSLVSVIILFYMCLKGTGYHI